MSRIFFNRRSILAGAAMLAAGQARADDTDVVIIGAGSAGIAAARELAKSGKRFILIESRDRAGGRVHTDTTLGQPFDAGAAYIHFAETNPWSAVAQEAGVDLQGGYRLWSGSIAYRNGQALAGDEMARRSGNSRRLFEIYEDIEEREDTSIADAISEADQELQDAARIQSQMAAGEDPERVSVTDWQRLEGGQNRLVPGGYGTLVAKTGMALNPRLGVKATAVDWSGQTIIVTTDKGTIRARKLIITVPIGVLNAGHIKFKPALPASTTAAIQGLRMGALSKIALRFGAAEGTTDDKPKERFGFTPHQFLAEIGDPARAMTFEAWPQNNDLVVATFGGDYARGLAKQGEAAAVDHALERFLKIAGSDARKLFKGGRLAGWSEDPHALGSYAVALPGKMRSRDALARPVGNRIWFAGEATAGVYSMTAGGAYIAGRDAARQVANSLSTGSLR
ncbi:MAG: flavin monoamine oxidase family protein [Beijerinckiaceae bacterium]